MLAKTLQSFSKSLYVARLIPQNGRLAQLVRAFAWRAKGRRFESSIVHQLNNKSNRLYNVDLRCDSCIAHK